MNIEKIKNWSYENWESIIIVLIILIVGISAYNYKHNEQGEQGDQGCKEFELIDKFEENPTTSGFIIYYSDGRIKEKMWLPDCIKLKKAE